MIGILVGAEFELASSTIKVVDSIARAGVVIGSGNWSIDSRGTRDSAAGEADIVYTVLLLLFKRRAQI